MCAICLEDIEECDKFTTLCGHNFHKECIELWLIKKTKCPICRGLARNKFETPEYKQRMKTYHEWQERMRINREIANIVRTEIEDLEREINHLTVAGEEWLREMKRITEAITEARTRMMTLLNTR